MSEESEHDLVGHRGSCLYREKIRRKETTLRRGYMGDPTPTSDEVEFARVLLVQLRELRLLPPCRGRGLGRQHVSRAARINRVWRL